MEYPYKNLDLKDLPGEIWKGIEKFEDTYQVSSLGRIKSLDRYVNRKIDKPLFLTGRILKQNIGKFHNKTINENGLALKAVVSRDGKAFDLAMSRVLYQTFIGKLDEKKYVINIDGNGLNNRIDNLKMISISENHLRSYRNKKTIPPYSNIDKSEIRTSKQRAIKQFDRDGNLINEFHCIMEATRQTGHNAPGIISAAKGRYSHHHGFIWRYADEE